MTGTERRAGAQSCDGAEHTVERLIESSANTLESAGLSFGHGSDNALDEAFHLVLFSLGIAHDKFETLRHTNVSGSDWDKALALIQARIDSRQPAAYLTGRAWLHGLTFHSDARALVPRSLLVEAMTDSLPDWMQTVLPSDYDPQWPNRVLDLCCGSGSIAIHAARLFPQAQVWASDVSEPALALCRENLALHRTENRIQIIQSDLLTDIPKLDFDLIVCNPPYVNEESMQALPAEYRAEPELALHGGSDGMDLIARIMRDAPGWMAPRAVIMLEIGHEAPGFETRFADLEFHYLPVSAGDQMVVALTREQLQSVAA